MRRSPGEYIVLASLIASLAFWACLMLFGTLSVGELKVLAFGQLAIFLGLGTLALLLLVQKRLAGAVLCMIFYAIQVVSVTLPSGQKIGFNSLPTIYYRIYGNREAPTNINVVSLVLLLFSIALWFSYRRARTDRKGLSGRGHR